MSKVISTQTDEPIAEGRVGLIYTWEEGKVIKLARDWVPFSWIEYEHKITSIVQETGIKIPKAYELLEMDGRAGIVYDRVSGPTMLDLLGSSPLQAVSFGRSLGILQAEMHNIKGSTELPDNADRLREKIETVGDAPEEMRAEALRALKTLPEASALLHGDFHPGNIMLTKDGPMIIDWPDATIGHPLSDVARTVVLISMGGFPENPVLRTLVTAFRWTFKQAYLSAYFRRSPYNQKDLKLWLFPVIFARLSEGIEAERAKSIQWLKKLSKSLPQS